MRKVALKRRDLERRRKEFRTRMLAGAPWCQIAFDDNCTKRSTEVHERLKRSRGGSIVNYDNCVACCHNCNQTVEKYPAEATERGWLVPSWSPQAAALKEDHA